MIIIILNGWLVIEGGVMKFWLWLGLPYFIIIRIVNNFVFYGVGLKSNDLGVSPYLSFCISASMEILSIMFSHAILDKLGRKGPYCALLFLSGVCCLSIIFIGNLLSLYILALYFWIL